MAQTGEQLRKWTGNTETNNARKDNELEKQKSVESGHLEHKSP